MTWRWFFTEPGTGIRDDLGRRIRVCHRRDLPPDTLQSVVTRNHMLRNLPLRYKWILAFLVPLVAVVLATGSMLWQGHAFSWTDQLVLLGVIFGFCICGAAWHSFSVWRELSEARLFMEEEHRCLQCWSELNLNAMDANGFVECSTCGAAWRLRQVNQGSD